MEVEFDLVFACCFCGKDIERGSEIAVAALDPDTGDLIQQWWAHPAHLLEPMVEEAKGEGELSDELTRRLHE